MTFEIESKFNKEDVLYYGFVYDIQVKVIDIDLKLNHDIYKFFYLCEFTDGRRDWLEERLLSKEKGGNKH